VTAKEPADDWESLPTMPCRACGQNVPAGAFCGVCGAALSRQRGDGPVSLRIRAYAAAPDEHLVRPLISTSIFPQLPRRSRSAFRVGLILLAVLLVAFTSLRLGPPLIGISALGLPLLFLVYLKETDAFEDLSIGALAVSAVLGGGLGIGWAVATEAIWARTYDDVLGTPMTAAEALINLLALPVIGVLLMLLPVAVVRLRRPGVRESLDGFTIGALGALCFTAAGILTRGAPEFANGLVARDFPMDALFSLAAIRGIAGPLTAAAVGGMVGAALWFRPRTNPETVRHWYSLTSPAPAITIALLAYVAQNAIDFAWISYGQIVGLYATIAVFALLALRAVLQCTVLGEASDGTNPTQPVLCPQCDHVVPDRAFCVNCGIAANASSRSSRRARRADRPVSVDVPQDGR
jgi:RsiW-degrading membrane proteinase PrsW (M82 family)